ncbi:tRNA (adenosine(37)-N6)-dimethylallyltransferase MiaA [Corynebacterium glucuronolyticum]|uniref:tRNA (adenosine(37)-N6)-dimethylallyltransferase MiaA n=1 Tax=Corynebacterium glucuronolyticum TaxID=39791 RepID=UPI00019C1A3B|nr:tRNA (adenosine(37)-N6)-dimethylallyltransferase MiaA [Corynebacterium glucuronolyticum]EEI26449.1 tRNA dimethylallyltransferase [Corynebacterium glucuronolyticum ATCC 51867]QRO83082.1 tRNA (adenosine(37)-N6)-dimethylallyltransferase MiaA [Corynebacterium glucuronolyticum]
MSCEPVAIVGPTASGKSDLSLDVCELVGGEVVNMDSMQLYRGMDIGTAKVPVEERRGIAHHLLDIWDVTQEASVQRYQYVAEETINELRGRGVRPVLVGGSMMYYQSLVDAWRFPPTDAAVRSRWEKRGEEIGVQALHAELAQQDPEAARIIEQNDLRRTVRALEVIELTGCPYAASMPTRRATPRWGMRVVGLATETEWLNPRIEKRSRQMFATGLVEETRSLVEQGLTRESTAGRAIGYAQVLDMDAGLLSPDEAVERTIMGTRRYVRRQRSWFKRDPRITWFPAQTVDAERVCEALHLGA